MPRRKSDPDAPADPVIRVRRIHRRDLNRVWDFLKRVFRAVNRETVEYQRPRTKTRFLEIYEEEGIEQLLFEAVQGTNRTIVGYAECAYEVIGSDNWINERYFENRDMRPLFVEEIAINPDYQGRGIGSFVIEQLEHLARVRGCTHLVLEVAYNNKRALQFYRARSFSQIDAAIFLAKKVVTEPELLPPRPLDPPRDPEPAAEPEPESPDLEDMLAAPPAKPRKPRKPAGKPTALDPALAAPKKRPRPRSADDPDAPKNPKKRPSADDATLAGPPKPAKKKRDAPPPDADLPLAPKRPKKRPT